MEYRIVHSKGFSIIGFRKRITLQFTGENHQIDSLNALLTDDARGRLLACNDELPKGIVSVSADFSDRTREGSYLDQYLGVASSFGAVPGFDSLSVPESDWAVFPSCGSYPEALQNTWPLRISEARYGFLSVFATSEIEKEYCRDNQYDAEPAPFR